MAQEPPGWSTADAAREERMRALAEKRVRAVVQMCRYLRNGTMQTGEGTQPGGLAGLVSRAAIRWL